MIGGGALSSLAWTTYYDELAIAGTFDLFEREADFFVSRLCDAFSIDSDTVVIDFGCGFGAVAERLAARGAQLRFWDSSVIMRLKASQRLAALPQASLLDLSDPGQGPRGEADLVIVNSVAQYMTLEELVSWLQRWRTMLKPGGAIVLSDIVSPGSTLFTEVRESLRFAARQHILWRTVPRLIRESVRYTRWRNALELLRLDQSDLSRMAKEAGLKADKRPQNLTFRSNRWTAFLTLREAAASDRR